MGAYDYLKKKGEEAWDAGVATKDAVVDTGGTIYDGLTDKTGDVVDSAQDFSHDAQQEFKEYVTDPVVEKVEEAQEWSHNTQETIKDGAAWTAEKAAEGYVENTEFLFGEGGWFEDVSKPVEQAWLASQDGNYLQASIHTGEAFLNSVDIVGTGGLGKQTYDWIMGSTNADDDAGPLYWEVLDEQHLMVAYENEETFFKFDNPENMEKFILELEAQSEGSQTAEWSEAGEAGKDYTDYDTQGTENHGYAGGGDTAGETGQVANQYKTGTDSGGREYIIGGL